MRTKYSDSTCNLYKEKKEATLIHTKANFCTHTHARSHCMLFAAVIRGVTARQVEVTIMGLSYFCSPLSLRLYSSDIPPSHTPPLPTFSEPSASGEKEFNALSPFALFSSYTRSSVCSRALPRHGADLIIKTASSIPINKHSCNFFIFTLLQIGNNFKWQAPQKLCAKTGTS